MYKVSVNLTDLKQADNKNISYHAQSRQPQLSQLPIQYMYILFPLHGFPNTIGTDMWLLASDNAL